MNIIIHTIWTFFLQVEPLRSVCWWPRRCNIFIGTQYASWCLCTEYSGNLLHSNNTRRIPWFLILVPFPPLFHTPYCENSLTIDILFIHNIYLSQHGNFYYNLTKINSAKINYYSTSKNRALASAQMWRGRAKLSVNNNMYIRVYKNEQATYKTSVWYNFHTRSTCL